MLNTILFLISCSIVTSFVWYFWLLGGKTALVAWVAVLSLLTNLFVLKQIQLFYLNSTASEVFAIGNLLALNLIQEHYGQKEAKKAIWISFSCLTFFLISSQLHLFYEPSSYDQSQQAYAFLLLPAPRILFASLSTFMLVDQFDSYLYRHLRAQLPRLSFIWISSMTIAMSQLLDTLLFSFLGLYGMVGALFEIIAISYIVKLLAIVCTIPWSFLTQQVLMKNYAHST